MKRTPPQRMEFPSSRTLACALFCLLARPLSFIGCLSLSLSIYLSVSVGCVCVTVLAVVDAPRVMVVVGGMCARFAVENREVSE